MPFRRNWDSSSQADGQENAPKTIVYGLATPHHNEEFEALHKRKNSNWPEAKFDLLSWGIFAIQVWIVCARILPIYLAEALVRGRRDEAFKSWRFFYDMT